MPAPPRPTRRSRRRSLIESAALLQRTSTPAPTPVTARLMPTTLHLDDDLAARAEEAAAREGTTVARLLEEGLRLRLRLRSSAPPDEGPPLPVFDGGTGLAPGLDPSSNRAVRDALDDADRAEGKIR